MSVWRQRARQRIAKLVKELPETATIAERKMWGKEVRAYLALHGDALGPAGKPDFKWPDDIAFPFREQNNG